MAVRFWIALLFSLFVTLGNGVREEYYIHHVCRHLTEYYRVASLSKTYRIETSFGKGNEYIGGVGNIAFSPKAFVDKCTAQREGPIVYMNGLIQSDIEIQFTNRHWVQVERGLFNITITSKPIQAEKLIKIIKFDLTSFSNVVVSGALLDRRNATIVGNIIKRTLNQLVGKLKFTVGEGSGLRAEHVKYALTDTFQYFCARVDH